VQYTACRKLWIAVLPVVKCVLGYSIVSCCTAWWEAVHAVQVAVQSALLAVQSAVKPAVQTAVQPALLQRLMDDSAKLHAAIS
jgi:hypothetical protein